MIGRFFLQSYCTTNPLVGSTTNH